MKKKKRGIEIKINFSRRWLYTLIVIGILALVSVGVYAVAGVSHDLSELDLPSCSNGQVLGMSGGSWGCVDVSSGVDFKGWSFSNDILLDDNEQVIKTNDEWLRLNQEGHFTSGVYTPGKLRAEGGIYVGDDEYFYRSAEDVIKTDDSFTSDRAIQGNSLKPEGDIVANSECSESQWGTIKRCFSLNQVYSICVCSRVSGRWKWRILNPSS